MVMLAPRQKEHWGSLRRFKDPIPWGKGSYVGKKKEKDQPPSSFFPQLSQENLRQKLSALRGEFSERDGAEC
jgi:hypothetical protein